MADPVIVYYYVSFSMSKGVDSYTVNGVTYTTAITLKFAANSIITVAANINDDYNFKNFVVGGSTLTSNPITLTVTSSFSVAINAKWARLVWINTGTADEPAWTKALPWIYTGEKWQIAKPFIYNEEWKKVKVNE